MVIFLSSFIYFGIMEKSHVVTFWIVLFSFLVLIKSAPIPQDGTHGWSDGPNDGISPGFKALLAKLKEENPEAAARGELDDPTFEADGVHKDGTYGWSDGANDGIPPGFKALLDKLMKSK